MNNKNNKIKYFEIFLIVLITSLSFAVFLAQSRNELITNNASSDMLAYMKNIMGIESGYSFPYPIMFWLGKLFYIVLPIEYAMALTVTCFYSLTVVAILFIARRLLKISQLRVCEILICASVMIYAMLFVHNHPFPGIPFRYVGVFSPNPIHNATYIAARAFTIIAFFFFAELLDEYMTKIDKKKWIVFSIALLLATMTKPSFTIIFCAAAGLIMLFRLIWSKGKILKPTVYLGLAFIPTFLHLIYQYSGVFSGTNAKGEETGIGIGFLVVWGELVNNIPLAIILPIASPIVILLFHIKDIKNITWYRLSWQVYLVGLISFMLLYEKGFRMFHMNFSWGYMAGMFTLVLASLMVLLIESKKVQRLNWKLAMQWGIYILHVACGIVYYITMLFGGNYY